MKENVWRTLLRIQQAAVEEWMDQIRNGVSINLIAKTLPSELRLPDFLDQKKWRPGKKFCYYDRALYISLHKYQYNVYKYKYE